jgi:hypothetical protein
MTRHLETGALLLLVACLPACGDNLHPGVISTVPESSATDVALTTLVSATFSDEMNAGTFDATTVTLREAGVPVLGVVTFDDATRTATFTPATTLEPDRHYTAMVTTGAAYKGGAALEADYVWSFTTANIDVSVTTTTAQSVLAPDYLLSAGGLLVLTGIDGVVSSATGEAVLTAGGVTGQGYVVVEAGGLDTYAEIDAAFAAGTKHALVLEIPAADFTLVGTDLTATQVRTLIIANTQDGVASYEAFAITFRPAS